MNETEVSQYISQLEGVDVQDVAGNLFFFYNPPEVPPDHRFPFVTLMTNDENDGFSDLNRPEVYRLNIGVSKSTFVALFGLPPAKTGNAAEDYKPFGDYDYTALDQLMPHPVYGRMYWVCIANPDKETFATEVQPLLTEAYNTAVGKHKKA